MIIKYNPLYRVQPVNEPTNTKNDNQKQNNKNQIKSFSEIFDEELNKYRKNKNESSQ